MIVHDLLLSKRGIAAPQNHPLNLAVSRHKARLQAEFTKLRIRKGFVSVDEFRKSIENGTGHSSEAEQYLHPRWVRINTLRTTFEAQMATTFLNYERVDDLKTVMSAPRDKKIYHLDQHISDLIAIPPLQDLSKTLAYRTGHLIFQDKASCIPAVLLEPERSYGDIMDACSAPGNKATHLAALLANASSKTNHRSIFAVERDATRSKVMQKMITQAGADKLVNILGSTDFLQIQPDDESYAQVSSILLDPSCSGSGIVGRDDQPLLELPEIPRSITRSQNNHKSKKRKFVDTDIRPDSPPVETHEEEVNHSSDPSQRLQALSNFQLKIVQHAMLFPSARRIIYSTCSIHVEENEGVVVRALTSPVALKNGWRILPREQQISGMRAWHIRGDKQACDNLISEKSGIHDTASIMADACIRCEKGTVQGTMGFFAVGFVRALDEEVGQTMGQDEDDEWEGFSETD